MRNEQSQFVSVPEICENGRSEFRAICVDGSTIWELCDSKNRKRIVRAKRRNIINFSLLRMFQNNYGLIVIWGRTPQPSGRNACFGVPSHGVKFTGSRQDFLSRVCSGLKPIVNISIRRQTSLVTTQQLELPMTISPPPMWNDACPCSMSSLSVKECKIQIVDTVN